MKIKLNIVKDIQEFVQKCSNYDAEITVKQGRWIINAKSVLGMYSLDLSNEIEVSIDKTDKNTEEEFYDFISKWKVEE